MHYLLVRPCWLPRVLATTQQRNLPRSSSDVIDRLGLQALVVCVSSQFCWVSQCCYLRDWRETDTSLRLYLFFTLLHNHFDKKKCFSTFGISRRKCQIRDGQISLFFLPLHFNQDKKMRFSLAAQYISLLGINSTAQTKLNCHSYISHSNYCFSFMKTVFLSSEVIGGCVCHQLKDCLWMKKGRRVRPRAHVSEQWK